MVDYRVLLSVGLSKTAVACYEDLFQLGRSISATELAERLHKQRGGLYRVLRDLEMKGFVTSSKIAFYPFLFRAVPIDQALRNYSDYQWRLVNNLFEEQRAILAKRAAQPDYYRGRATF